MHLPNITKTSSVHKKIPSNPSNLPNISRDKNNSLQSALSNLPTINQNQSQSGSLQAQTQTQAQMNNSNNNNNANITDNSSQVLADYLMNGWRIVEVESDYRSVLIADKNNQTKYIPFEDNIGNLASNMGMSANSISRLSNNNNNNHNHNNNHEEINSMSPNFSSSTPNLNDSPQINNNPSIHPPSTLLSNYTTNSQNNMPPASSSVRALSNISSKITGNFTNISRIDQVSDFHNNRPATISTAVPGQLGASSFVNPYMSHTYVPVGNDNSNNLNFNENNEQGQNNNNNINADSSTICNGSAIVEHGGTACSTFAAQSTVTQNTNNISNLGSSHHYGQFYQNGHMAGQSSSRNDELRKNESIVANNDETELRNQNDLVDELEDVLPPQKSYAKISKENRSKFPKKISSQTPHSLIVEDGSEIGTATNNRNFSIPVAVGGQSNIIPASRRLSHGIYGAHGINHEQIRENQKKSSAEIDQPLRAKNMAHHARQNSSQNRKNSGDDSRKKYSHESGQQPQSSYPNNKNQKSRSKSNSVSSNTAVRNEPMNSNATRRDSDHRVPIPVAPILAQNLARGGNRHSIDMPGPESIPKIDSAKIKKKLAQEHRHIARDQDMCEKSRKAKVVGKSSGWGLENGSFLGILTEMS